MELQIDLKPESVKHQAHNTFIMDMWIDGQCFSGAVSFDTAKAMVNAGIVHQTLGKKRNAETGKIETFEYENNVDGAGVQYTSKTFEMYPLH